MTDDRLLGRTLDDRYQIRERLGEGGMGAVYKALQLSVGREVAIKVIHERLVGDRTIARRFLREVAMVARLASPHTVSVFDFGETADGVLFLVMELLTGRSLDAALAHGPLPSARVIEIGIEICEALIAAHALGFVHRDLKPSNVFLVREAVRERVKVLDFGVARTIAGDESTLTGSNQVVGTLSYTSPEAIRGDAIDGRADLYSLGCLLHELCSGAPPFRVRDAAGLVQHLEHSPPPLPGAAPALAAVIRRLMAKRPADRYASAEQTREALLAATSAKAPPAPSASTASTSPQRPRALRGRPPWPWRVIALTAGIALAAAGGGAIVLGTRGGAVPSAAPDAAPAPDAAAPPADATRAVVDAAAAAPDAAPTRPRDRPSRPRPAATPRPRDAAPPPPPRRPDAGVDFVLPGR